MNMFEMSHAFEQPSPEKHLQWNGKKVEHDDDRAIITIKKEDLGDGEQEFQQFLKEQFPGVEYVHIHQPYIESEYAVFERKDEDDAEDMKHAA